jgi:hypothetical protein
VCHQPMLHLISAEIHISFSTFSMLISNRGRGRCILKEAARRA